MKSFEKDFDHMLEEQNEEEITEGRESPDSAPETDSFLRELKEVLEISKEDSPEKTPAAEEAEFVQKPTEEETQPECCDSEADAVRASEGQEPHPEEEPLDTLASIFSEASAEEEKTEAQKEQRTNTLFFEPVSKNKEEARKEPDVPPVRENLDDDDLLAELHELIGDSEKPKDVSFSVKSSFSRPERPLTAPAPRPLARITPDALQNEPEELEGVMEADTLGVPGWLKGAFILLLSLLLCAMTFYAVASDVIGEIF